MISALISASTAIAILVISQWIIFWRERSRLLLGKLEDLYILLLDLGERNLTRFEPLMSLMATESIMSSAELIEALNEQTQSLDQVMASDFLERVSLLVDFYFPQLRPELDQMFEANRGYIGILHGITKTELIEYEEVKEIATTFADRTANMRTRILAERDALTKAFTSTFRAEFERLRALLRKAEEKSVHSRMETDE
jgi:hypothetical protein